MGWKENINQKLENNERVDLLEDLPIKKDLWLKNFIKSATSVPLFALGFNFIFAGFSAYPHNETQILLGVIASLLALIIIFVIDSYHQQVRKYELMSINNNQTINEDFVNNAIKEIIKEDLKKALYEDDD